MAKSGEVRPIAVGAWSRLCAGQNLAAVATPSALGAPPARPQPDRFSSTGISMHTSQQKRFSTGWCLRSAEMVSRPVLVQPSIGVL